MNREDERAICRLCNEEICDGEEWTVPRPEESAVHVECFRTYNRPIVFRAIAKIRRVSEGRNGDGN